MRWLNSKESTCQCWRCRFNSWVNKIPWRRKWQSTSVFLPEKRHGQRRLVGYRPRGRKESGTAVYTYEVPRSARPGFSSLTWEPRHLITEMLCWLRLGIGVGICRITWEVVFFFNPQIAAQLRMTKLGEEGGLCSGLYLLKNFLMIVIYLPSSSFEKSWLRVSFTSGEKLNTQWKTAVMY